MLTSFISRRRRATPGKRRVIGALHPPIYLNTILELINFYKMELAKKCHFYMSTPTSTTKIAQTSLRLMVNTMTRKMMKDHCPLLTHGAEDGDEAACMVAG
jgi:hypothetical protein